MVETQGSCEEAVRRGECEEEFNPNGDDRPQGGLLNSRPWHIDTFQTRGCRMHATSTQLLLIIITGNYCLLALLFLTSS